MFIKAAPVAGEDERRGSVSNWFSSLRRGGRKKREESIVPASYGSLGRRKDGAQPRGKTRSAWDLTNVTRLIGLLVKENIVRKTLYQRKRLLSKWELENINNLVTFYSCCIA